MQVRPVMLTLCASTIAVWTSAACAQTQFKEVTVGNWTVEENLDGAEDDETVPQKKPTGRPNRAYTLALNGRNESLSFECSQYDVVFYFGTNDENFISARVQSQTSDFIFTKVDSDHLYPRQLDGGAATYFQEFPIS